jgi:hypothetical protein
MVPTTSAPRPAGAAVWPGVCAAQAIQRPGDGQVRGCLPVHQRVRLVYQPPSRWPGWTPRPATRWPVRPQGSQCGTPLVRQSVWRCHVSRRSGWVSRLYAVGSAISACHHPGKGNGAGAMTEVGSHTIHRMVYRMLQLGPRGPHVERWQWGGSHTAPSQVCRWSSAWPHRYLYSRRRRFYALRIETSDYAQTVLPTTDEQSLDGLMHSILKAPEAEGRQNNRLAPTNFVG